MLTIYSIIRQDSTNLPVVIDSEDTDVYVQAAHFSNYFPGNLLIKGRNELVNCKDIVDEEMILVILLTVLLDVTTHLVSMAVESHSWWKHWNRTLKTESSSLLQACNHLWVKSLIMTWSSLVLQKCMGAYQVLLAQRQKPKNGASRKIKILCAFPSIQIHSTIIHKEQTISLTALRTLNSENIRLPSWMDGKTRMENVGLRGIPVDQGLLYHRTCKPDFRCRRPSLNSYLK